MAPLEQKSLQKAMLRLKREFRDTDEVDYYTVSKPLFYYFALCFGGGPAIVKTNYALYDQNPMPVRPRQEPIQQKRGEPDYSDGEDSKQAEPAYVSKLTSL